MIRNEIFVVRKNKYKESFISSGMNKEAAEKIADKLALVYSGLQEGFFLKCAELDIDPVESSNLWNEELNKIANNNF